MQDIAAVIELLLIALVVALFTKRVQRPYTIGLVIWGLIIGMLQLVEPVRLSKELVLTVFLPPLLFEGALHIQANILRRRAGLIFGLVFVGTLLTALIVGVSAHLLLGFELLTGLLLGVVAFSYDIFTLKQRARAQESIPTISGSEQSGWWQRPLSLFEMAGWFVGLWFFGLLITGGLLSFSLPSVRMGDPALPYLLNGIGYSGLVLVTAGFALRFLRAFEGGLSMLEHRHI